MEKVRVELTKASLQETPVHQAPSPKQNTRKHPAESLAKESNLSLHLIRVPCSPLHQPGETAPPTLPVVSRGEYRNRTGMRDFADRCLNHSANSPQWPPGKGNEQPPETRVSTAPHERRDTHTARLLPTPTPGATPGDLVPLTTRRTEILPPSGSPRPTR